ncbi:hypothetical protein GCM10022600_09020 [Qipengyuania pelagi]|jgi:flagellar basal-body rod modification protein FlgD|uniref:Basal-body rod modification protein FlgD n=1 Tax=Qipengyuania pelagi TaxID=994320 RepID=A0A844YAF0_9SPHN|nr:flagellar hook capping FlgD N-terminal domain-containing protein [Qipengyuania pelagi]MEC7819374.1 flagellar hook capping FlgD N-terminal domain-containing protein [Pseudomonadota bacterium]MXO54223.1 flagellar biosynthesis protein FlgD [Qipengyuania pelagi]
MVAILNNPAISNAASSGLGQTQGRGMDSLGQGDFLKLLTVQMQQQDPFDPVDNKDMLAQMAQFSALAGSAETNAQLEMIAKKLDQLIDTTKSAQTAA